MADSNMTKKAFSSSVKVLMDEKAFEKISIGDICSDCGLNRKTFYYHFKDKYDLINWVFNSEFAEGAENMQYTEAWDLLIDLSYYLYENKKFYRKALSIKGQNSFLNYFREYMFDIISMYNKEKMKQDKMEEFRIILFADSYVMALKRWLVDYADMMPEKFLENIKSCIEVLALNYKKIK